MRSLVVVFVVLVSVFATNQESREKGDQKRITNGNPPSQNWGFFAKIYVCRSFPEGPCLFNCGGTLISPDGIVTAAHCVESLPLQWSRLIHNQGAYFYAGIEDATTNFAKQMLQVKSYTVHPSYVSSDERQKNNIAILHLRHKFPYVATLAPCSLNTYHMGSMITVIGAGNTKYVKTENDWNNDNRIVDEVKIKEVWASECSFDLAGSKEWIDVSSQICLYSGRYKGATNLGDTGSPAFYVKEGKAECLYGLVSHGWMDSYKSALTRVSKFRSWINKNMDQ